MVVTPALSSISPKWAKDIVYLLAGDNYKKKHIINCNISHFIEGYKRLVSIIKT